MSATHRILISDKLSPQGLDRLAVFPDLKVDHRPGLSTGELLEAIGEYDALIVRSGTKVTAEIIAAGKRLKLIGRAGIGVDNIDVKAATKRGIVVMNTPGGNNVTTAEHTITLMLSIARNITQASASLGSGKWERSKFTGVEVSGKTLGIVGVGNIGSIVADRAKGLHMKVIGFDPYLTPEVAARLGIESVAFDELLVRSDFISIHTPLTSETRALIGTKELAKTRKGVRIINCARGGIVDENALAEAVRSGHVAGAAVDVFEQEPPSLDNPLLGVNGIIATPHLGASTDEAQINVAIAIAEQVADFLRSGEVRAAINFPSMNAERAGVIRPFLTLAEKIGLLQTQTVSDAPVEVEIEGRGEIAKDDMKALSASVLKGLLDPIMDESVNFVNAPGIAADRGIRVLEAHNRQPANYLNLLTVRVRYRGGTTTTVAGAVFGHDVMRIVRINKFYMEAVPNGNILILNNRDVPGVVGVVGTLLGEHGINIAGIELGRDESGMAISFFHVDEAVPDDVLQELRSRDSIVSAHLVRL